ncbi:pyruvate formate-lyase-activating protein [Azospirillum doebereinerae]|uniref:pyruvate formate-lyase-activating protein n=1 Tax=Azospirillum doebereinerae TaxID=92933 RepID=UPI001EE55F14|nr:pyruvate formate-lyase-activating protein [Azospirillum doebereinerae]MCG5240523.1 pyruvate formate-lyase-activating protein [Azospirillum doebereinerae]
MTSIDAFNRSGAALPSGGARRAPAVSGWVHSVETGGTVDGPGIRYVLFLAGCPLRCQYCHNPDTQHMHDGTRTDVAEVLADIESTAGFLRRGHGGVTLSGGEPLVQPEFCAAILRGCKELGLHTALDTSGFLGNHADDYLLADVDLVLLDIKAFKESTYREVTGSPLRPTLEFAERLAGMNKPIWLRYVLVPGLTDNLDEIAGLADFAAGLGNVQRVDVLPFHKMGEHKWQALGRPYRLSGTEPPDPAFTAQVRDLFRAAGLNTP